MDTYGVIIWADRKFNNPELLKTKCDYYLSKRNKEDIMVLTTSENKIVESYASDPSFASHKVIKADWENKGKRAGYLRNLKLTELGNALIAFLGSDCENKGADNIINLAREQHLRVAVVKEIDQLDE